MRFGLALATVVCVTPVSALAQQEKKAAKVEKAEEMIGWGKEQDGLQAGLFLKNPSAVFRYGDKVEFALRVRNVGRGRFAESVRTTPRPSYGLGAGNCLRFAITFGDTVPFELEPGEEKTLPNGDFAFTIVAPTETSTEPVSSDKAIFPLMPGKYQLVAPMPLWIADDNDPNRATGHRVKTGILKFEVRDKLPLPNRIAEKGRRTNPPDFNLPAINWGEVANGLQGGIGVNPDAKNGVKAQIPLTFYVRNITKLPLTISYTDSLEADWFPMVKDEKGEQRRVNQIYRGGLRGSSEHTLQPNEVFAIGSTTLGVKVGEKPDDDLSQTPTFTAPAGRYSVSLVTSVRLSSFYRLDLTLITAELPFTLPPAQ